jgi:hypothetical protein
MGGGVRCFLIAGVCFWCVQLEVTSEAAGGGVQAADLSRIYLSPIRNQQDDSQSDGDDGGDPSAASVDQTSFPPASSRRRQLPTELAPGQYAESAFAAAVKASSAGSHLGGLEKLRSGQLPTAVASDAAAPLPVRLRALQTGLLAGRALALVPAAALAELVGAWVAEDAARAGMYVRGVWRFLTEGQVRGRACLFAWGVFGRLPTCVGGWVAQSSP